MTQEEIIQLAKAYGFTGGFDAEGKMLHDEAFVVAVTEAVDREREACAKACETGLPIATSLSALDDMEMWGEKFAAAIRARGET